MTEPTINPPEETLQPEPVSSEPAPIAVETELQADSQPPDPGDGLPDPADLYPRPVKKGLPVWLTILLAVIVLLGAAFGGLRLLERSALDQASAALDDGDFAAAESAANRAMALPFKTLQAQPEQAYLLRGQALFHQGRLDEALQDLLTATQTYPQDAALQGALAHIYLAQGNLEAAYAAGETARAADDSLPLPYALEALKAYNAYQWKDALTAANAALERGDNSGLALRIRGTLAAWVEDFTTAKADLEKAAEQAPQDIEIQAMRVYMHTWLRQDEPAKAALDQVMALSTESAASMWAQALVEYSVNNNESEAARFIDGALALDKRPEFHVLRAMVNPLMSPEAEKAIRDDLDQALTLNPDFFPALFMQTHMQMVDYELDDFEAVATRLETIAPKSHSTQLLRVQHALINYQPDDAVKFATLAVERAPDVPITHSMLAMANQAHQEYDTAWQEIETALELDPDHYATLETAFYLALARNEFDKALGYIDQLIAAHEDRATPYALKALVYNQQDHHAQATAELKKAIAIDPFNYAAIKARMDISSDNKDTLTMLNDVNDLIKRTPKDPNNYIARGWIYLMDENVDKAREDANTAMDMSDRLPAGKLLLASVFKAEGRIAEAITYAEKSLEIDPFQTTPHLMMTDVYYYTGERDKALAEAKSAANIAPWDDEIQYILADTYRGNGKIEEALPILEKLMEKKDDLSLDLLDRTETLHAFVKTVAPLVDGKRTQVDTEHHFSVAYPADTWFPEVPERDISYNDSLFWVISTASSQGHVGLKLFVHEIEGAGRYAASLWAYAVRQETAKAVDDFQFFSSKTFRAAGMTGTVEDFQFTFVLENGDSFTIREKAYYFVKGDLLYVFEYMNSPANFDSKAAQVDEIVLTFSIPE